MECTVLFRTHIAHRHFRRRASQRQPRRRFRSLPHTIRLSLSVAEISFHPHVRMNQGSSMNVTIEYAAQIKRAAGVASEQVTLDDDATLRAAVQAAIERHDESFRSVLLNADGDIHPSILVFVGEEQVRPDADPSLNDGDRITLLSPISGG